MKGHAAARVIASQSVRHWSAARKIRRVRRALARSAKVLRRESGFDFWKTSVSLAIARSLQLKHLSVASTETGQFFVFPFFGDAPVFEHDNTIRHANG